MGDNAFKNTPNYGRIYVPSNLEGIYEGCTNWSVYATKIDAIPAEKLTVVPHNISLGTLAGNWSTYYNSAVNMQAPKGVTVYKATLSGTSLSLIPIADRIITAGQAVILKKATEGSIVFSIATATPTGDYSDNVLKGVDATTTIGTSAYADKVIYTLAGPNGNLGFYKYTGTTLGANKAFLALDAAVTNNAREFLFSFDAETTEIVNTDYSDSTDKGDGQIYDLQGRKVQQPVRGIYVKDGKKIVVK